MIGNCPKCAEPISGLIASSIRLEETTALLRASPISARIAVPWSAFQWTRVSLARASHVRTRENAPFANSERRTLLISHLLPDCRHGHFITWFGLIVLSSFRCRRATGIK
jgi:hypothetical protein